MTRAVATLAVVLAVPCAGCARAVAPTAAVTPHRPGPSGGGSWPVRTVVNQRAGQSLSAAVVDAAAGAAYLLVSRTQAPQNGPYLLERVDLRTGALRMGPAFAVGGLAFAAGRLWVSGTVHPGSSPVVTEVDPLALSVVRTFRLPAGGPFPAPPVAQGPAGSVWTGSQRTLLRVSAASGAVLNRVALPAGLALAGLSADPAGSRLYVSATHLVHGGGHGAVILEFGAGTGRELAKNATGTLRYSAAGAALTAVPGGVWVSFRTGMLGLTVVLRQDALTLAVPRHPEAVALGPADGIFHWPMYTTTVYGGGALWLSNQTGVLACLDPLTGRPRASEEVPGSRLITRLALADPVRHLLYGVRGDGLAQITPPRRCWA